MLKKVLGGLLFLLVLFGSYFAVNGSSNTSSPSAPESAPASSGDDTFKNLKL